MEGKAGVEKPPLPPPPQGPQRRKSRGWAAWRWSLAACTPAQGEGRKAASAGRSATHFLRASLHPPSTPACPSLHTSEVLASCPLPPGLSVLQWTVLGRGTRGWQALQGGLPGAGSSRLQPGPTWGSWLLNSLSTWVLCHPPPNPTKGLPCLSAAQGLLFPQPSRKFHQPGGSPGSGTCSPHQ